MSLPKSAHLHPIALCTHLSPPDQLVTLVSIGLIDLHERVRLAEQILEVQGKEFMSLRGRWGGSNAEKRIGSGPWNLSSGMPVAL